MNKAAINSTLAFLLSTAFRELYGARKLVIEHSFGDAYFCHRDSWEPITPGEIKSLQSLMEEWIESDIPLQLDHVQQAEILSKFTDAGLHNKPAIIRKWNVDPVPIIRVGSHYDYRFEPMCVDKDQLKNFELLQYERGILLRFPTELGERPAAFSDRPKLFSIVEEYEQWGKILQIESIPQLNEYVRNGIKNLVWVAEGLHEKKIVNIVDKISSGFHSKRVIFIAGPSSSGKTTFAKRLSIQLNVNGYSTQQISMDDYFMDRDQIPADENGHQDFEAFEVLNADLLTERLERLLSGESIPSRQYDFNTGRGVDDESTMTLADNEFIIIEGIHCLNPRLTQRIADGNVQKIYVSAMTQLNVDADHRVSTSENRLLRRMVRDYQFRGYSPEQTLLRWPSVRAGEERNIFPFQEEADFMFNTALVYELSVLTAIVRPLLNGIPPDSDQREMVEKLNTFVSFFEPLSEQNVPGTSILREFIGGSDFSY